MTQETGRPGTPAPTPRPTGDGGAAPDRRPPQSYGPRPMAGGPRYAPHPGRPGMPLQGPPGQGWAPGWVPIEDGPEYDADYDTDDPRPPGNGAAAFSAVLGVLALLVSLRPLAFGSMALAWDTFVGIGIALLALVAGAVGLRTPVRRPVAAVGMTLAVVALLVVAVLPTF
ncbi:hypothetical protein [Actinomycetospora termitidis]|uniref:Uncharacterized protein n=1 Tax=Actinomycetospora termitidis TaxID=3053470 RepID=A0ABT7M7F3_9PSEU|nr:hypothetical protein [Actinomycetospora sp. Odt1-22]MDL5156604.1 hypothetical protein [Actinomycetospora sp. Odt1-22]